MRRSAIALAVLSAVALCSCAGGGTVLNSGGSTPDRVILTVQGASNVPRVLAGSAVAISAVGVRGSGNGITSNNSFFWTASIVNGGTYVVNSLGATKPCAPVTDAAAAAGPFTPYAPDYSVYIAIDPVNEGNVVFNPPLQIPLPAGMFLGILPASNAYCVVINAKDQKSNVVGSLTVAVVNPQLPLQ